MHILIPTYRLTPAREKALKYVLNTLPGGHPVTVLKGEGEYNKPRIVNDGVDACTDDIICVLDGDIILRWDHVILPEPGQFVRPFSTCIRLSQNLTQELYESRPITPDKSLPTLCVNGGGAFIMHRKDYIDLGGMHEGFVGWGYEDADLGMRVARKLKVLSTQDPAWHLWHEDTREHVNANRKLFMTRSKMNVNEAIRQTVSCFTVKREPPAPVVTPPKCDAERKPITDMCVITMFHGYNPIRFESLDKTLAAWDATQEYMPEVHLAWCYKDRPAPDYPWLKVHRLPEYDLADGVMRKEGLTNLLLRRTSHPKILTLDADAWCEDPQWFKKISESIQDGMALQPYARMQDTHDKLVAYSFTSRTLPAYAKYTGTQPGLGWAFTRGFVLDHGFEPVFNPWCITGSGDAIFMLEHCRDKGSTAFASRHLGYRYITEHMRELKECKFGCLPFSVWHQCHTDHAAVPAQFRNQAYADRSYRFSREAVNWWGSVHQYIHLDENGVPMLIDPNGPFAKFIQNKPRMQTKESTLKLIMECFNG